MKKFNFLNGVDSVRLRDAFGHGLFSIRVARVFELPLAICPEKPTKAEYDAAVQQIRSMASFFFAENQKWFVVGWEERHQVLKMSLDCVKALQDKVFDASFWVEFASFNVRFHPKDRLDTAVYEELGSTNIMVTPAKLYSDGNSAATPAQQSLSFEFFDWLARRSNDETIVLGQHFSKSADFFDILELADSWNNLYIPGVDENEEVLGLRDVNHSKLYDLYSKLDSCIGIPGTHTWYLLTAFPHIPQVVVYNRNVVENWEEIAAGYCANGYSIVAIGFDNSTDMEALKQKVRAAFENMF